MAKLGCSAENAPPITLLRALGSGGVYTPAPHSHWLRAAPRQVRPVRSTGKVGSGGQRKPSGTEMQTRCLLWLGVKLERPEAAGARGLTGRYTHCRFNRLTACQSRPLLPSASLLRPPPCASASGLPSPLHTAAGAPYSESKLPLPRSVHVPHHKGAGAGPDLAPLLAGRLLALVPSGIRGFGVIVFCRRLSPSP